MVYEGAKLWLEMRKARSALNSPPNEMQQREKAEEMAPTQAIVTDFIFGQRF